MMMAVFAVDGDGDTSPAAAGDGPGRPLRLVRQGPPTAGQEADAQYRGVVQHLQPALPGDLRLRGCSAYTLSR